MRFAHALIRDAAYHRLARSAPGRAAPPGRRGAGGHPLTPTSTPISPSSRTTSTRPPRARTTGKAIDYARRAGARAVALLAYEEAVRLYELALAALDAGGAATAAERCELLLALGDAQGRRGDDPGAKVDVPAGGGRWRGPRGLPELLARAAAGYGGRFLWTHGLTDERLVPLLEEGLAAVGHGRQRAARPAALAPGRGAAPRPDPRAPRAPDGRGDPDGAQDRRPGHDRVRARPPPSPRCTRRTPRRERLAERGRDRRARDRAPATASGCSTGTSTRSGPPGSSATPIAARASSRR